MDECMDGWMDGVSRLSSQGTLEVRLSHYFLSHQNVALFSMLCLLALLID